MSYLTKQTTAESPSDVRKSNYMYYPDTLDRYSRTHLKSEWQDWLVPLEPTGMHSVPRFDVFSHFGAFVDNFSGDTPLHEVEVARYYFDLGAATMRDTVEKTDRFSSLSEQDMQRLESTHKLLRWLFMNSLFNDEKIVILTHDASRIKAALFKAKTYLEDLIKR